MISCHCHIAIQIYAIPRPTIAESVAEASPGRRIHIWQMQDPNASEEWLSLPMLMNQYADKTFAQYQLEIFEASKLFEKGRIKETKLLSVKGNCIRPLVLMHSTGEPANSRYIKDHLFREEGKMKLKERADTIRKYINAIFCCHHTTRCHFQIEDIGLHLHEKETCVNFEFQHFDIDIWKSQAALAECIYNI